MSGERPFWAPSAPPDLTWSDVGPIPSAEQPGERWEPGCVHELRGEPCSCSQVGEPFPVVPVPAPRTVSCGCCSNGCVCWHHQNRPHGVLVTVCAYHRDVPHPRVTSPPAAR